MTILVVTASTIRDSGVSSVIAALRSRGADVFRFDTDSFPTASRLRIHFDKDDRIVLSTPSGDLDLRTVSAVWVRHFDAAAHLPEGMAEDHLVAARLQSDRAIGSLLECLPVFQLDPPGALSQAPNKPRQLQLARSLGLEIPRTIVTNDPEAVRAFASTCGNGVVAKLIDSGAVCVEREGGPGCLYTTTLSPEDFEALGSLRLSPMIFQERILKALELRITVVGRRLFVASIDAGRSARGSVDWRSDGALLRGFRAYSKLPGEIEARINTLMDRLGLNFGTIDMIITPDRRHVFLEVNTTSFFDFVEEHAGLPISDAIADVLVGCVERRPT